MEIDIDKLKKSGIFVDEFLVLALINEGLNPKDFSWSFGAGINVDLELLEENLWIKKLEDGYELRQKGRELFESKSDDITEVIEYLNSKTKRNFSPKSKPNRTVISGRLSEGYTKEDLMRVVDTMQSKWGNDVRMNMYLRPETLFNATKFQTYINLVPDKPKTSITEMV